MDSTLEERAENVRRWVSAAAIGGGGTELPWAGGRWEEQVWAGEHEGGHKTDMTQALDA